MESVPEATGLNYDAPKEEEKESKSNTNENIG